jgi:hypothetical protein
MILYPHPEAAPPLDPFRRFLWRIRKATRHWLVNFTKWYCGADSITLSYPQHNQDGT